MPDDLTTAEYRETINLGIQLSAAFREHLAGVFANPTPELLEATRAGGFDEAWLAQYALQLRGGRTDG